MCFNILLHLLYDVTSQLEDEKSEKKLKHIPQNVKKINNSVVTCRKKKFKIIVKRQWYYWTQTNSTGMNVVDWTIQSLFWQITTIHWNSTHIEPHRMKKFIFFDIVSFTLCLESLILQQGADSSLVEGKSIKFLCKHNQIIDRYITMI